MGSPIRVCLQNGVWSGSMPSCICKYFFSTISQLEKYTHQHLVIYVYFDSITHFSSSIAVVNCGALANPVNGLVDTSGGTTFGTTATYSCNLNFMLMGSSTRSCTVAGVWGGQPPTCIRKC